MSLRHIKLLSPPLRKMTSPVGVKFHRPAGLLAESSPAKSSDGSSKSKSQTPDVKEKDQYSAGQTYFNHNGYTFYDFELAMEKDRKEQPSSEKAKPNFSI